MGRGLRGLGAAGLTLGWLDETGRATARMAGAMETVSDSAWFTTELTAADAATSKIASTAVSISMAVGIDEVERVSARAKAGREIPEKSSSCDWSGSVPR